MGGWREKGKDLGLLVLRVMAGLGIAGLHGYGKMFGGNLEGFAKMAVEPMGFPFPLFFAYLSAMTEFFAGLFIAAGLLTRLTCLPLIFNMGVALIGIHYHHGDPISKMEPALSYLTAWLTILLAGPGAYSFDHLFLGKKR
ncbi:MAG: DoxX family protein [Candidatus Coatesbacteria bacterium]